MVSVRRLYLVAGIAIGYVLGTRAGRERYEELMDTARRIADRPEVQSSAGMLADQLSQASRQAMALLGGRVSEQTKAKVARVPLVVIPRVVPGATAPKADEPAFNNDGSEW
jgi:hypothetical protein